MSEARCETAMSTADSARGESRSLCLVISSLAAGGAERVMTVLANWWAARGDSITIVTFDVRERDFFPLHPSIRRISLGTVAPSFSLAQATVANGRRTRKLRQTFNQLRPTVIISFGEQANVVSVLAAAGLGIPIIISERTDPRHNPLNQTWSGLRRVTYPFATRLVVQTRSVTEWARGIVPAARIRSIANPLDDRFFLSAPEVTTRATRVAAVGRVRALKGFDILIRAFALVANRHPLWRLEIIGRLDDINYHAELVALAESLSIGDRIRFLGEVSSPEANLREASVFVLSSRFEGFPNALIEAMACGCAVISTACPSGPDEIITQDQDGLLIPVDDIAAMAASLDLLMRSPSDRLRLSTAARTASSRWQVGAIAGEWDRVVAEVSGRTSARG